MATELPPITVEAPRGPGVTGTDTDTTGTPRAPPTVESITGTPGTGGLKGIGTYHGYPIPDPHQVWKFDVFLPPLVEPRRMPIVQSIEPGFDNTSPESHGIGGRHQFGAAFFDATELRILFYDDENHLPLEYIYAWKKLMRNYNDAGIDDGTYKYPKGNTGYFRDIDVYLYDMKNQPRYNITYKNCFPTVMAPLRLDYEPSHRTVIAQAFAVNRITTLKMGAQSTSANPSPIGPAGASFNLTNVQRLSI